MEGRRNTIGGALLVAAASAWIAGATVGGTSRAGWCDPTVIGLFVAGGLCLIAAVVVLAGPHSVRQEVIQSQPIEAPQVRQLVEPDLAPAAISELERVRPGLAARTLAQDSADVENALAKAYRAFHGTGVKVLHSPAKIPTDLPHDKFLERLDEVIRLLREHQK